jgi:hypothetical protein
MEGPTNEVRENIGDVIEPTYIEEADTDDKNEDIEQEIKKTEFFKNEPEHIDEYHFGDTITRENFINFLIFSFAISRGDITVQQIFFKWVNKTNESDVENIISQFGESGSIKVLSKSEIDVFEKAFNSVRTHHKVYLGFEEEDLDDEIVDGLEQISADSDSLDVTLPYYDLDSIVTLNDFNTCTKTYFQKVKGR